jgi:Flp pilus assembly protein TadB
MHDEQQSVARPSLRDWYAEGLVFLTVTCAAAVTVALVAGLIGGRSPVVDAGALLVGICGGLFAARWFRVRRRHRAGSGL